MNSGRPPTRRAAAMHEVHVKSSRWRVDPNLIGALVFVRVPDTISLT